ncbi:MAG: hypothetical protein U0670_23985 [Anaerolineae bacterium]
MSHCSPTTIQIRLTTDIVIPGGKLVDHWHRTGLLSHLIACEATPVWVPVFLMTPNYDLSG